MHPNVFMKLSSELQVMCHLSKVQLRNFWTWIQMILRIFCGNKGTVLPFSYWICCFCRFQSAPDFLRSWAFTATCLPSALRLFLGGSSAADLKSASLRLWKELVISLLRTCSGFFYWFGYISNPLRRESRTSFCNYNRFIRYTVLFWLHTWNAEDSEGESKKHLVHFCSILSVWFHVAAYIPKNVLVGVN